MNAPDPYDLLPEVLRSPSRAMTLKMDWHSIQVAYSTGGAQDVSRTSGNKS